MNYNIQKQKDDIEKFLKSNEDLENMKVDYILTNQNTDEFVVFASDGYDEMVKFTAETTKDNKFGYHEVPEWDYSFEGYVFEYLENDYRIDYMDTDTHYGIWNYIKERYPEDVEHKEGMQLYLQYCADNGITKEYLDGDTTLNTPDIMEHFSGLAFQETMKYKGYIIEADDNNYDAPKENLVNIYKSKEKYEAKESLETISLNTVDLKQNIKDYIDDNYEDNRDYESEKNYFAFILGREFLYEMLAKSSAPENDISYDFCNYIADKFLDSEEYKNEKYSGYEMLEVWVRDNKKYINKEYNEFIGEENKTIEFQDGLVGLEFGKRNDSSVVLIERNLKDYPTEYIIAFNYEIKDNKITWGYGYYYGNDYKKAEFDFNRVLEGQNLADTFKNNKVLTIKSIGHDEWDRPVYRDEKYNLYKDINLGKDKLELCTVYQNKFEGEPYCPVDKDIVINIVKEFEKKKNKDKER